MLHPIFVKHKLHAVNRGAHSLSLFATSFSLRVLFAIIIYLYLFQRNITDNTINYVIGSIKQTPDTSNTEHFAR